MSTPPTWVVERASIAKSDAAPSEDALVVTEHFAAVLDGMSSPLRAVGEAPTGRAFAAAAAAAIESLDAGASARDAIDVLAASVRGVDVTHAGPAGVVVAIVSRARREVWRVGDVHVRVGSRHLPAGKRVDTAMAMFRAAVDAAHLAGGASLAQIVDRDPGLAAAAPLLAVQGALANHDSPWGYGVIDGGPVLDRHIERIPIDGASELVLATDGYTEAAASLALAERSLAAALQRDPACIDELLDMGKASRPGAHGPDDRTYLRVDLGVEPRSEEG